MKRNVRKLQLTRETLRDLAAPTLKEAAGAVTPLCTTPTPCSVTACVSWCDSACTSC